MNDEEVLAALAGKLSTWVIGVAHENAWNCADALLPIVRRIVADELREAAWDVETLRPHIPPSTDPDRRTRIVQRSSLNRAASAVRARADALAPDSDA